MVADTNGNQDLSVVKVVDDCHIHEFDLYVG